MLLYDEYYRIDSLDLNDLDKMFINISYDYYSRYPLKWIKFIDNIVSNINITFFRDTTAIIQISKLSIDEIDTLFSMLKLYLNENIVIKVIYKKEFVIVHFNEIFHIDLLKQKFIMYSIKIYKYLLSVQSKFKIYLYCTIKYINICRIIPFVIIYNKKIYLFDNNPIAIKELSNIESIYLFYNKRRGYNEFRSFEILICELKMYTNLIKLLF